MNINATIKNDRLIACKNESGEIAYYDMMTRELKGSKSGLFRVPADLAEPQVKTWNACPEKSAVGEWFVTR